MWRFEGICAKSDFNMFKNESKSPVKREFLSVEMSAVTESESVEDTSAKR